MPTISQIGLEMLRYQEQLAKDYHYKPIEPNLFTGDVRSRYKETLPDWCSLCGNQAQTLITTQSTPIATGYTRIVIGDYGAFVEIDREHILRKKLMIQPGQEFRMSDNQFVGRVKYFWLTARDCSHCKIYEQQRTVDYADYKPGMFYISPFEVFPQQKAQG